MLTNAFSTNEVGSSAAITSVVQEKKFLHCTCPALVRAPLYVQIQQYWPRLKLGSKHTPEKTVGFTG